MAEAKPVVLTNMCMIRDGEKVLVQIRNDKRWGGAVFPGGHIEDGESITDSVIREVFEETGLTVLSPMLCGVKNFYNSDGDRYIVFLFKADKFTGTLRSSSEGEVLWEEEKKLFELDTVPGMKELYEMFCSPSCGITTVRLILFRANCANKTLQIVDKI